ARALLAKARTIPGILLRSHAVTTELVARDGRVTGLRFLDERSHAMHEVKAAAVALATGGLGQVYPETTRPESWRRATSCRAPSWRKCSGRSPTLSISI